MDKVIIGFSRRKGFNLFSEFICSELAYIILKDILSVSVDVEDSADLITPKQLHKVIMAIV